MYNGPNDSQSSIGSETSSNSTATASDSSSVASRSTPSERIQRAYRFFNWVDAINRCVPHLVGAWDSKKNEKILVGDEIEVDNPRRYGKYKIRAKPPRVTRRRRTGEWGTVEEEEKNPGNNWGAMKRHGLRGDDADTWDGPGPSSVSLD
ncbi:hypothetical protein MNV49_005453 [Pseudohyphozyma bogoriensis]|nr:hypothetical protein MNV49_005453 [Pseudohyphozyma bogoriensis]